MGIRFRSYSVYGLGYCPTMSWSAIIIVNFVCDTYTSFVTRLHFDLYTFWEIFGWVWLLEFCVQQFWACKFRVSLCLLLLVWRREAKRVETKRIGESWREERSLSQFDWMTFFWSSCGGVCDDIKFYYMEMEQMFVRIVEWGDWFGWRPNCVCQVCRCIYDRSSLPYQGTVSYWLITAFSNGQVVVCGIIVLYCAN